MAAEEEVQAPPSGDSEEKPDLMGAIVKNFSKGKKLVSGKDDEEETPKLAGKQEYDQLIGDRPKKMTAAQVGFKPQSDVDHSCAGCFHYFTGAQANRSTCEIFRPEGGEESVPGVGVCQFWTKDMEAYPLLTGEDKKEKKK